MMIFCRCWIKMWNCPKCMYANLSLSVISTRILLKILDHSIASSCCFRLLHKSTQNLSNICQVTVDQNWRLKQLMGIMSMYNIHAASIIWCDTSDQKWQTLGMHHCKHLHQNTKTNKAIVDIRLYPHCALPSPLSRSIGHIAYAIRIFRIPICACHGVLNDPFCCMTLLAIELSLLQRTRLQRRLPVLLRGLDNPLKLPVPHWISSPCRRRTDTTAIGTCREQELIRRWDSERELLRSAPGSYPNLLK